MRKRIKRAFSMFCFFSFLFSTATINKQEVLDIEGPRSGIVNYAMPDISSIYIEENSIQQVGMPLYFDDDVELLATLMLAEAEGESELGKRLVVDSVLNRVDSELFPDTIESVIFQKGQYTAANNGRMNKCSVSVWDMLIVADEMSERTNNSVIYFNSNTYCCGKPLFKEGHHYFSSL